MSDLHLLKVTELVTRQQEISDIAFAEKLGCNAATVSRWRRNGIPLPWKYVLQALQDKKITFEDLVRWRGRQHAESSPQHRVHIMRK